MEDDARELEAQDPTSLQDGRYLMKSVLGEGSMGRTYLAEDTSTDTMVAVKALYPSRLADFKDLELFQREAEVLKRLNHPQIPRYIDAFHEGEGEAICYYLAQEWVDGKTLREIIDGGKRFDEAEVVALARDILTTLQYMQGLDPKVVHRDIKPANIIIRSSDNRATLVDFGAVREVVRLTMGGGSTIIGTYGYMPPEQLMGRALPATDLYALGITLLECLTHQTPQDLHGQDAKRLIDLTKVSDDFRRVLGRLTAPSMTDRFSSAEQVTQDLDRLAAGSALVHVKSIESDMAVREREKDLELKRASKPELTHYIYFTLIGIAGVAAIVGVIFVFYALTASFQAGFLIAALMGGTGLLGNLILVGRRYTHDAWEPPKPEWVRATAKILSYDRTFYVDANGREQLGAWEMHYEFSTRNSKHKATKEIPEYLKERFEPGYTFSVWYPPANPEFHEAADFRHRDYEEMERLFNHRVVHTPE